MVPKVEKIEEISYSHLAEGPHWDIPTQSLYFVDIYGSSINRYHPATKKHTKAVIGTDTVSFIIPVEGQKDKYLISIGREVVLISWDGESDKYTIVEKIAEVDTEEGKRENQLNDGKADALGRLWTGGMCPIKDGKLVPETCSLLSIGPKGEIKVHEEKITVSNGHAWNSDNTKFYYIDSPKGRIDVYDFDLINGTISNPKILFKFKKHDIPGYPDGMTIDSDDNLWVADCCGSRVIKVDTKKPETLLKTITLPAIQVTCVTFGGSNLDELYVTTGAVNMGGIDAKPPENGAIYKITDTGSKGRPAFNVKL